MKYIYFVFSKTKSAFFLITFFLVFINNIQAQNLKGIGFEFGITNANQELLIQGNERDIWESRLGLNIGLFYEYSVLKSFSTVVKLNYIHKGVKPKIPIVSVENPDIPTGYKYFDNRIDYLSFLLSAKFKLLPLYLITGPRYDHLINKKIEVPSISYEDLEESVFGLSFGAGVQIEKILPVALILEVLYNIDLTNSYKIKNRELKNETIDFKLGIMF